RHRRRRGRRGAVPRLRRSRLRHRPRAQRLRRHVHVGFSPTSQLCARNRPPKLAPIGGSPMAVAEKVKSIIVEQLGVDAEEATPAASFTDDLGADSLDIVELVMSFEEEFGIEISDEDAEGITTVQDAVN